MHEAPVGDADRRFVAMMPRSPQAVATARVR